MARGINKVILLGHLGRDPEVKYMPNGNAVTNMTIATSESWKDKNTGQPQDRTEWHRVVIFGKLAEIAGQYLKKGSLVYVEGQLQTRKWTDQSGQDRYSTEIVINPIGGTLQMLDRKGSNDGAGNFGGESQDYGYQGQQQAPQQSYNQGSQSNYQQPKPSQQSAPQQAAPTFDDFDDDIPF